MSEGTQFQEQTLTKYSSPPCCFSSPPSLPSGLAQEGRQEEHQSSSGQVGWTLCLGLLLSIFLPLILEDAILQGKSFPDMVLVTMTPGASPTRLPSRTRSTAPASSPLARVSCSEGEPERPETASPSAPVHSPASCWLCLGH